MFIALANSVKAGGTAVVLVAFLVLVLWAQRRVDRHRENRSVHQDGVPFDTDAFQREALEDAERILEDVARDCSTEDVTRQALLGAPAETLVKAIASEAAEPLVVGRGVAARCVPCSWEASRTRCTRSRRARW